METTTKKERVVRDDYVVLVEKNTEGRHRLHRELHKLGVSSGVFSAQSGFHEQTT